MKKNKKIKSDIIGVQLSIFADQIKFIDNKCEKVGSTLLENTLINNANPESHCIYKNPKSTSGCTLIDDIRENNKSNVLLPDIISCENNCIYFVKNKE